MSVTVFKNLTIGDDIRYQFERFQGNAMLMDRLQNILMMNKHLFVSGPYMGHNGMRDLCHSHFLAMAPINENLPIRGGHAQATKPIAFIK